MSRLSLSLMGTFEATLDGRSLTGFESAKARALLAYIAVEEGRIYTRAALAGLFWPELSEESARTNLRQVLANLRQLLDDRLAETPHLLITRDSVQLNPDGNQQIDIVVFKELLATCDRHSHRRAETCRSCAGRLTEATALYRGSFLQGLFVRETAEFEEWTLHQRESLHQRALSALSRLAVYHEQCGAYAEQQAYARRMLELDPWGEEAHRQLMRALAQDGQRSAALAQYERCRHILREELGIDPAGETTALYERIRSEQALTPQPLRAAVTRLPLPLTPFVGRQQELAELARLVEQPDCRLVTLVGPGGVGKTRLALRTAADERATFRDGVYFVPLAPVSSAEFVVPAIATALSISFDGTTEPAAQLLDYLRGKELLLILDNLEHLLQPESSLIELLVDILEQAPGVVVIATSRERLRLQAEWVVDVAGLAYPSDEQTEDPKSYSAVQLFAERVQRAQTGFVLVPAEEPHVSRICRLLEGLPLGIELAAASVSTLSCLEIAQELETTLLSLATTFRDVPGRHRSLRAALDHSWRLLTASEQRKLRQLAVFRGGFEPAAADTVAGATLPTLFALVEKSLLQYELGPQEVQRFDLHETVRQYAWELLQAADEAEQARARHLDVCIALVEEAEEKMQGAEQAVWLERLEREHDNLRAALSWCRERQHAEAGVRLGGALWRFWYTRGYLSEGRHWLETALELMDQVPAPGTQFVAKALNGAENLTWIQGDYVAARKRFDDCLALRRILGDKRGIATVLNNLGNVTSDQRDYPAASVYYDESLTLWRELGDQWGMAIALMNLGSMASERGDRPTARTLLSESLALRRELGDKWGIAGSLDNLGLVALDEGDYATSRELHTESLALRREMGDKWGIAVSLHNLGSIALEQGDYSTARALHTESLILRRDIGQKRGIPESLEGLAALEGATGTHPGAARRVARLYGAAAALRAAIGVPLSEVDRRHYERSIARTRRPSECSGLGRCSLGAEGEAMPLEAAIAYALEESTGI